MVVGEFIFIFFSTKPLTLISKKKNIFLGLKKGITYSEDDDEKLSRSSKVVKALSDEKVSFS